MGQKKYLFWLIVPLCLVILYFFFPNDEEWLELEEKQELFKVEFANCNCEQSDHDYHPDHYLAPREVVINFFGYLKAGEYANVASFFDPDVMIAYFYEERSQKGYEKRIREFGTTFTRNQTLEDIRIVDLEKIGLSEYLVKVEMKFKDKSIIEKEIRIEERITEERLERESFIISKPSELLEK